MLFPDLVRRTNCFFNLSMILVKRRNTQPPTGQDSCKVPSPNMQMRARFSASSRPTEFDVQIAMMCIASELNNAGILSDVNEGHNDRARYTYVCIWQSLPIDADRMSSITRVTSFAAKKAFELFPHISVCSWPLILLGGRQSRIVA